jgi:hypothetical protein
MAPEDNGLRPIVNDLDGACLRIGRRRSRALDAVEEDADFVAVYHKIKVVLKPSIRAVRGDPPMKGRSVPDMTAVKRL